MHDDLGSDERGISEILGTVLLISMVLLGSATVIIFGASAISDATQRTTTEAATDYLQEADARLATLSASSDHPEVVFDPQDAAAKEYSIHRDGYLNVTVNDNPDCSFQQPLSTIVFEDSNGNRVGYEAGGVWRGGVGGSTYQTPPDVTLSNGRLDVNLVNVTGTFDQSRNRIQLNVTETRNRTSTFQERLVRHDCSRPDTVSLRVQSDFYDGWADYLEADTGIVPTVDDSDRTVTLDVDQNDLHPTANDKENKVVNLGGASYMDSVTLQETSPPELGVDKNADNTYTAYVGPVTNESLDIGEEISVDGTNITGPPLDVSLVLDESGSMNDPVAGGGMSKIESAKDEAQNFVGYLDDSRDRVSVISYDTYPYYQRTAAGEYFSSDFSEINDTIEHINALSGTRIDRGLDQSNSVFDLKGNESRQKVTVLLTDGVNWPCRNEDDTYDCNENVWTRDAAWEADNDSITVYTIGFGDPDNVDQTLLEDVAESTGGRYYAATNANALQDAFKNISERIEPKDAVANIPITSNVSSGGTHYAPEIPGDVSHIANTSDGDLNINDPTAPTLFSHSFTIDDGETFALNVTDFECQDGHYNVTGETVQVDGETRSVARCTQFSSESEAYEGDIYVDEERPDTLLQTTYADWQTDVNKSLRRFPSTSIDPATGELNTTSNQALVAFDLPPTGPGSKNTLVLLTRIGLAETSNLQTGIVTVQVSEAEIQ